MNWDAVNFDWNQARAFLATAEEGSLSAAARALKQTQPTLGRQVTGLEEALGVVLFERVGRGLILTPAGTELLGHVRAMRDAANRVSLTASGQAQGIDGKVTITASDIFSAMLLPPVIAHLRDIAPNLEIELVAANDIADLQRREADIAIRHVRPEQPDLIARLLLETEARFYASRSYLDRAGRPEELADLAEHSFIAFVEPARMVNYLAPLGVPVTIENFKLGSANGMVAWEFARQGLGIAPMSDWVAERTPEVEVVLPDFAPFAIPVWLTAHRELHAAKRIRLVYDTLAAFLIRELGARG